MATLYRNHPTGSPDSPSGKTLELPLEKYIIFRQPNRAKALRAARRISAIASLTLTTLLVSAPDFAVAQNMPSVGAAARAGAIAHAQKMRRLFPDIGADTQPAPAVIPQLEIDPDPSGAVATFRPSGPMETAENAFFQDLGKNGRTCFTCHQPEDAWSISAQHVRDRFDANPNDPLFRLVDGATCPTDKAKDRIGRAHV